MSALDIFEVILCFGAIILLTPVLGKYMANIFE